MPQITVRPYREDDREAFFHVRAMTYNDGRPIAPEDQVFKTTRGYVGEVDGKVVGVYSVLDFTCTRGSATVRDAAVAGVAVLPEYRMTGVGGEMMRWAIRRFREEGVPMASLYAFRESYYRKFGYEVCGSRIKISVPNEIFPKVKPSVPVRRLSISEAGQLQPCYEIFCHQRSGMNVRTENHWSRVIGKDTAIYVAGGNAIEAYILLDHRWQFWETQTAAELIWSTGEGYESILSMLAASGINKSSVEWYEPSDSPFLARHMDHGVKANAERLVMYRVCDVPACLRALQPKASDSFYLSVSDDLIPENEGPWHVEFSPDEVKVTKTDKCDIQLTINQFAQAFLGQPSLADFDRNGIGSAKTLEGAQAASLLLPPLPVYCADFF